MSFGSPGGMPALPTPLPPPKADDPAVAAKAAQEAEFAKKRKGRASTMLTSGFGDPAAPAGAGTKTNLGGTT